MKSMNLDVTTLEKFLSLSIHFLEEGITQNWKCCGNRTFESKTFLCSIFQ